MTAAQLPTCPECGDHIRVGDDVDYTGSGMVHRLCNNPEPHACPLCNLIVDWSRHGYWIHVDTGHNACPGDEPAPPPRRLTLIRSPDPGLPQFCGCGDPISGGTSECATCANPGDDQ